jgi:hypothetical protein
MKHFTKKVAPLKNMIRERHIPEGSNVIGLLGPDMEAQVAFFRRKGYDNMWFWENNHDVVLRQASLLYRCPEVRICEWDLVNAPIQKNTFYDLDLCERINAAIPIVTKFKSINNFILTVSERGVKKFSSIPFFIEARGEEIVDIVKIDRNQIIFNTDKKSYRAISYFDTSAMLIIKPN